MSFPGDGLGGGNVGDNLLTSDASGLVGPVAKDGKVASLEPDSAEIDGNVVRYRVGFSDGTRGRLEVRTEADVIHVAVAWTPGENEEVMVCRPPSVQMCFDLGLSMVAPLVNPRPGQPGPLPMPCLLQHGTHGALLADRKDGGDGMLVSPRMASYGTVWKAVLVGQHPDAYSPGVSPAATARWDWTFSVPRVPMVLDEVIADEPRLASVSRHLAQRVSISGRSGVVGQQCDQHAGRQPPIPTEPSGRLHADAARRDQGDELGACVGRPVALHRFRAV